MRNLQGDLKMNELDSKNRHLAEKKIKFHESVMPKKKAGDGDDIIDKNQNNYTKSTKLPQQKPRNRGLSISSVNGNNREGTRENMITPNTDKDSALLFDITDDGKKPISSANVNNGVNNNDKNHTGNNFRTEYFTSSRSQNQIGQFEIDDFSSEFDHLNGFDSHPNVGLSKRNSSNHLDSEWIKNSAISLLFMFLWYAFSLTISVYNKWMFSAEHLDFKFPILTTSGHQLMQFLIACLILKIFGKPYRRIASAICVDTPYKHSIKEDEESGIAGDSDTANHSRPRGTKSEEDEIKNLMNEDKTEDTREGQMSWFKSYLRGIVPTATASGADIGLGNTSLSIVSLSFYTMVKSSGLGFVLLFAILFKLEVPSWNLFAIIGIMTCGVIMMVAGEAEFSIVGFVFVLGAAMFSGLRWSLTQLLLRGDQHLKKINTHNDPIKTIMYIAPPMGIFLFIWGCISEGFGSFLAAPLWQEKGIVGGLLVVLIPGLVAFLMTISEFFLLNRTSVLTLSIAGIFKEFLTLIAAAFYFGDILSTINIIGLVVTAWAIVWYNVYRFRVPREIRYR